MQARQLGEAMRPSGRTFEFSASMSVKPPRETAKTSERPREGRRTEPPGQETDQHDAAQEPQRLPPESLRAGSVPGQVA